MTDRILTDDEVAKLERKASRALHMEDSTVPAYLLARYDVPRLIASHRLLAEMVKQYERKDYDG